MALVVMYIAIGVYYFDKNLCSDEVLERLGSSDKDYHAVVNVRNCGATTDYVTSVQIEGNSVLVIKGYHKNDLSIRWEWKNRLVIEYSGKNDLIHSVKYNYEDAKIELIQSPESWIEYINAEYGFELVFTQSWKGYKVAKGTIDYLDDTYYFSFDLPVKNKDQWSGSGYAVPLTIIVYPKSVWREFEESGEPSFSSYITENDKYVFAYALWQEIPKEMEGVDFEQERIISSFKFVHR